MAPELVVVRGLRDSRGALQAWAARPSTVLRPWFVGAGLVCVGLLAATLAIAFLSTPDPTPMVLPGVTRAGRLGDVLPILERNALVLSLHAMACVAGFIAGSSLPQEAARYRGAWRTVHDRAGDLAILFVIAATLFSLSTQAYVLGGGAATLAAQLGLSRPLLIVAILPHAVPELVGLFLPLAAWTIASRRGAWDELLAATFATLACAIPLVVLAAYVEVFVSPRLILALQP